MSNTPEKKWYVVRAMGGKEKKVKEYLESEINRLNLQDRIFNVLIPTEKYFDVRNGKRVTKERILFTGYVYVEAILDGEIAHVIKDVPNVLGFLTEGKAKDGKPSDPVPVRPEEMNRILGRMDEMQNLGAENSVPFKPGLNVIVTDGPFNTFSGTIEEVNTERQILKVSIKLFGRVTPLELTYAQVKLEN